MPYNSYFPMSYAQQYYPNYAQMQPQPQQSAPQPQQQVAQQAPVNSSIIWVQGEAGMKAYLVAPNTTVQLWDSERQTIYLKSADASGMPSVKVLDYTIRDQTAPASPVSAAPVPAPDYATKEEVSALAGQVEALKAEISGLAAGTKKEAKA